MMLTRESTTSEVLKLPFLALTKRNSHGTVPFQTADCPGHAVVFTTLVAAGRFLEIERSPELELSLIFRQSLQDYVDGLEDDGIEGVCVDANADNVVSLDGLRTLDAA